MVRVSMKAFLLAAATALAFVLHTVFFCSKKKDGFRPRGSRRKSSPGQDASSSHGSPEEQALLPDRDVASSASPSAVSADRNMAFWPTNAVEVASTCARAAPQPATTDDHLAIPTSTQADADADTAASDGQGAIDGNEQGRTAASPEQVLLLDVLQPEPAEAPAAPEQKEKASSPPRRGGKGGARSAKPAGGSGRAGPATPAPPLDGPGPAPDTSPGAVFLQRLIDAQLGPPRFAVPSQTSTGDDVVRQEADATPSALQPLLDAALGPPRFAVTSRQPDAVAATAAGPAVQLAGISLLKSSSAGPATHLGPASLERVLEDEVPSLAASAVVERHLRLEVLSGPMAGVMFDTRDASAPVRIGRLPDCSLILADDPEVSSNHAVIEFSSEEGHWQLKDVGSLNGSSLNGRLLSSNRVPSKPHALADGDVFELGSTTRVRVTCSPSQPRGDAAAAAAPGAAGPKAPGVVGASAAVAPAPLAPRGVAGLPGRPFNTVGPSAGAPQPVVLGGSLSRSAAGLAALSMIGPPLAVRHHEPLGLSLAVQQRLGADHKRTGTGCEDVPHWELPWQAPWGQPGGGPGGALLCLFDGHQGVKAATKAKEVLPMVLRDKLQQAAEAAALPGGAPAHGLVLGRGPATQAALLRATFLETDARIAMDEGCTATIVVVERDAQGTCVVQSANVGDSSALLVQLPYLPDPGVAPNGVAVEATHQERAAEPAPTVPRPVHLRSDGAGGEGEASPSGGGPEQAEGNGSAGVHRLAKRSSAAEESSGGGAPPPHNLNGSSGGAPPPATIISGTLQPLSSRDFAVAGNGNGSAAAAPSQALPARGPLPMPRGLESGRLEGGGHWIKMSEDHRISSSEKERARLAELGHKTVRTRLYGLNIARMLGDKFLKDEGLGFIADPHVSPPLVVAGPGHVGTCVHGAAAASSDAVNSPPGATARQQQQASARPIATLAAARGRRSHGPGASVLSAQLFDVPPDAASSISGSGSSAKQEGGAEQPQGVLHEPPHGQASQGHSQGAGDTETAAETAGIPGLPGRTLLVVASDGLWDVMGEAKAAALIARTCAQDPGTSVAELASLLLGQAVTLRSKDDITVMVLEVHHQQSEQASSGGGNAVVQTSQDTEAHKGDG